MGGGLVNTVFSLRAGDAIVIVGERGVSDAADRRFLADAVADLGGGPVSIEQICDRCGGPHGRPVVVSPTGRDGRTPHVSLSRKANTVAVAITFAGPVGVDIESMDAVSGLPFDEVAFSPGERDTLGRLMDDDGAWARTSLWTCKEAVLKATGIGLRADPLDLSLSVPRRGTAEHPTLDVWPGAGIPLGNMHVSRFEPNDGLVGAIAVIAAYRPVVRVVQATDALTVREVLSSRPSDG
jgi:4'-phosphopantetheinyl transferase